MYMYLMTSYIIHVSISIMTCILYTPIQWSLRPERCSCPHCERPVVTFIDYEASWVTWLLAIVVWFSLGWMAFWVLPLLWPAFKDL